MDANRPLQPALPTGGSEGGEAGIVPSPADEKKISSDVDLVAKLPDLASNSLEERKDPIGGVEKPDDPVGGEETGENPIGGEEGVEIPQPSQKADLPVVAAAIDDKVVLLQS